MYNEAFVGFETAKLLKEAGFPQVDEYGIGEGFSYANGELVNSIIRLECGYDDMMAAPTQAQAMRWLREEKRVNVRVNYSAAYEYWFYDMLNLDTNEYCEDDEYWSTYEAAAEEGIQAACQYLIEEQENN